MDLSFRSSGAWSNGISTFSGLTLGDISIMSVIALPICAAEISNAHHYTFGNRELPAPAHITHQAGRERACCNYKLIILFHFGFSYIFLQEGLYSSQEHPFDFLRRVFALDNPYLMLFEPSDFNAEHFEFHDLSPTIYGHPLATSTVEFAAEFDALLRSGDVGLLRALAVIKAVLAVKFTPKIPIEPFRVHNLIRKKRGYFGESLPLSGVVVEDFLAQERLFFHQLEDLPTVAKQMELLNILFKERLSVIFEPLYAFMHIQLRLLLDIERNLLLPPQSQRWS
ncbi:hypothetical protein V8F33_009936 [Rhypophila sp. PSN 637]